MKKLFISQPMTGKMKEEILAVRKRAIENAKAVMDDDVEVIESYFEDYNPDGGCVPLKYLSKSLELLADADIAYFAKGWESARGCRIEYQCATDYGIVTVEECTNGSSESGYNFGTALEIARHGGKIARRGWNGKGMFLYHVPAASYAPCTPIGEECAGDNGKVPYGSYIAMKTAQGNIVPWLASQTDMLAEDWVVVE